MNKQFLDFINDDDFSDELKAKMIIIALKFQKIEKFSEIKPLLMQCIEFIDEVENWR